MTLIDPTAHRAPGQALRDQMARGCVAIPGAYNGLVGRAVAQAGFDAAYISGAAVSAAAGVPDVGILTLEHFARVVEEVARSSGLPVLADADTGFGEEEMVVRTVHEYARAGGAGFHIEDQVFPKRCGHLEGKRLVGVDHMQEKVSAAAGARDALGGTFVVCARTDARGVEGMDEAIARARAYAEAGADMIFPEGLTSEAEFETVARSLRDAPGKAPGGGPYLLANMTEFGKTPIIPLARFAQLGYHAVIFPVSTLRITMHAVEQALAALKRDGDVGAMLDRMQTRADLYSLLGYTPGQAWRFPSSTRAGEPR